MKIFKWIRWLFLGKPTTDKPKIDTALSDPAWPRPRGHVPPRPLPTERRNGNIPPKRNPAPLAPARRSSDDSDPVPAILVSNTFEGVAGVPHFAAPVQHHDSFTGGGGQSAGAGASSSYGDSSSASSSSSGSSDSSST